MTNGTNPTHETKIMLHWTPSPTAFAAYKKREVELCSAEMARWGQGFTTSLFSDDTVQKAKGVLLDAKSVQC